MLISIHALREEGDHFASFGGHKLHHFNPRPPRGGRLKRFSKFFWLFYFNPRPPRGGRRCRTIIRCRCFPFQSTPSARRATFLSSGFNLIKIISIHALREEGDLDDAKMRLLAEISIHALREEGDYAKILAKSIVSPDFNPRPPRGGRLLSIVLTIFICIFQSTPSARRATRIRNKITNTKKFQSTPSARRATDRLAGRSSERLFQSTPSARRATRQNCYDSKKDYISIHALREEGDNTAILFHAGDRVFQSTPSARRATSARNSPVVVGV